jgi:hypothetical protein
MDAGRRRGRLWSEIILAIVTLVLAILTIVVRDWVEIIFGVEPVEGSGWFEVAVTGILALLTVGLGVAARLEWRRAPAR